LFSDAERLPTKPASLLTSRIRFQFDQLGRLTFAELVMSTAERIAWGLLSLIGLRWRGTPEDQKKRKASPAAKRERNHTVARIAH
jgi:hypothetical protein